MATKVAGFTPLIYHIKQLSMAAYNQAHYSIFYGSLKG